MSTIDESSVDHDMQLMHVSIPHYLTSIHVEGLNINTENWLVRLDQ